MCCSAMRSERSLTIVLGLAVLCTVAAAARGAAQGKVFTTPEKALELAFPDAEVERTTAYLDEAERARVAELAGEKRFRRGIVFPYIARDKAGALVGTAYFETHRVRTLDETLMVVVDPGGRLAGIELLAFKEPIDYAPKPAWYAQFEGKELDAQLRLRRGIRGVTGATLSARAATECARRTLALHTVLVERPEPVPAEPGRPAPEAADPEAADPKAVQPKTVDAEPVRKAPDAAGAGVAPAAGPPKVEPARPESDGGAQPTSRPRPKPDSRPSSRPASRPTSQPATKPTSRPTDAPASRPTKQRDSGAAAQRSSDVSARLSP